MKYNISLEGTAPLMMQRFREEEHGVNRVNKTKKVYNPEEEAEGALYKDKEGQIYAPAEWIYASLVKGATSIQFKGKKTYKDAFKANLVVEPEEIPLIVEKYEIDARPVVINRSRIMRYRPKWNEWKLEFVIEILDDDLVGLPVLKEAIELGGKNGLGDYRPRFGRYILTKIEKLN